jgi:hypothetical protein
MSAPLRATMNVAVAAVALALTLLGGSWLADRSHRWERPSWRHRSFVSLRGEPGRSRTATWVVAVNPRCPHCLTALARLHADWERDGRPVDLVSLIVDSPRRPEPIALRAVPTSQIWWDRFGVWRWRWGHRLYGELMQFDASGRLVRTVPAARWPDIRAPRPSREGGT